METLAAGSPYIKMKLLSFAEICHAWNWRPLRKPLDTNTHQKSHHKRHRRFSFICRWKVIRIRADIQYLYIHKNRIASQRHSVTFNVGAHPPLRLPTNLSYLGILWMYRHRVNSSIERELYYTVHVPIIDLFAVINVMGGFLCACVRILCICSKWHRIVVR